MFTVIPYFKIRIIYFEIRQLPKKGHGYLNVLGQYCKTILPRMPCVWFVFSKKISFFQIFVICLKYVCFVFFECKSHEVNLSMRMIALSTVKTPLYNKRYIRPGFSPCIRLVDILEFAIKVKFSVL
jgi:hypothetical protein